MGIVKIAVARNIVGLTDAGIGNIDRFLSYLWHHKHINLLSRSRR